MTSTGPDTPALTVESWPISRLIPYARNARTHSEAQVQQLVASMREFGWTNPMLVAEDGTVIAGHGRLQAAIALGLPDCPVIVAKGWTEAQRRAYTLADNKLALNAEWDEALLALELGDLKEMGADLGLTGFSTAEFQRLHGAPGGTTDTDDIPAPPEVPISRAGDIWQMGSHRLMCADCTNEAHVRHLIGGAKVDMLLTDPPYCSGGFQEAGKGAGSVGTRGAEMIANDTLSTRGYMALMKAAIPQWSAGVVYAFTDWRMWINLFDIVESSGYGVRNMVVWDKGTPGMGAGWRMQHELIMCAVRVKSPFNPKKAQGNVIQAKRTGNKLHATEKPVDLLATIIDVTDMAQLVADPFAGSGSTLIACEVTGRQFMGTELTARYCDVAVERWQNFTGKAATLEGDSMTFAAVKAARTHHAGTAAETDAA